MNRDEKAAVVDQIAEQFTSADAIFAVDYRGISVAQAADLRARLRAADARFRVVKNSLSERAADQAGLESIKPMLSGPTALTFVNGDAAAAAKALNDIARELQLLEFKGGLLGQTVLAPEDVRSLARLPTREVLYAQLVGVVASPLTGLVRTLNALITGLAIQLQAIVDLDPPALVSGEAPAAPAEPAAEPAAEVPETPAAEVPETPAAEVPETPAAEVPETPEAPEVPETPEAPEVPETPEAPEVPETPETPEVPEAPETPEVPDAPGTPEAPETPEAEATPAAEAPADQAPASDTETAASDAASSDD
jgi:large subunit ribosomal protein L10